MSLIKDLIKTGTLARRTFGCELQLDIVQEECAELIQAISHIKRGRQHVADQEMADVIVALAGIYSIFFSNKKAKRMLRGKLSELQHLIEKAERSK